MSIVGIMTAGIKADKYILLLFAGLTVLILWTMLAPGYILTLDMAWVPHPPLALSDSGFNNAYPVRAIIYFLSLIIPSWIVQKAMLATLFFLLFLIPWKFLPLIESRSARLFAAALYALNPFVYSRMLAGQWNVLFGYALFPAVIHALMNLVEKPSPRSALNFSFALLVLGVFSIHILYISLIVSILFITFKLLQNVRNSGQANRRILAWFAAGIALFLAVSLYWIVPATLRTAPIEARFNDAHFEAFAAAQGPNTPVMLNIAALGGFWGERYGWRYYFAWPQDNPLFWAAFAGIAALALFGAYSRLLQARPTTLRADSVFLIMLGVLAYITALGAADTPFRAFNMFLYSHVPFWEGLRDSQKISTVLAFCYATFAGLGAEALFKHLVQIRFAQNAEITETDTRNSKLETFLAGRQAQNSLPFGLYTKYYLLYTLFLIPIFSGIYMWGGFQKQLQPVWYPASWEQAKEIIDTAPQGEKVLILPWHGYLSLDFANQLVVSNPAGAYFGSDRVIMSRSAEIAGVYDQETDASYRAVDEFITHAATKSPEEIHSFFIENHIAFVMRITNAQLDAEASGEGSLESFTPFENATGTNSILLEAAQGDRLIDDNLVLVRVK